MNALVPASPAALAPVDDVWRMAQAVAKSHLFGMKTPEEAMALMLIAQAEGQHPAVAARDYHIVDGRPTLKADAMLARFMQAGGKVEWHSYTDEKVEATFTHPAGGSVRLDWTMGRAKKITRKGKPITDGDNWRNYPRQMLRARTISEGVRTVYPGVAVGVYTPEEAEDFDAPRNVTPRREMVETVKTVDDDPIPVEERGVYVACIAAIDLGETKADLEAWAASNEASLATIKEGDPEVYHAVLAYWRKRLKEVCRTKPATATADEFGLSDDDVPEFA